MKAFITISGFGVLGLLAEIFGLKKKFFYVAILGIIASLALVVYEWTHPYAPFPTMIGFDRYALAFSGVILITALLWMFMSDDFFADQNRVIDHSALVLFTVAGGMLMTSFNNMSILFLGLETLSLSVYVLAGSRKNDLSSNEAALKYFMMGSFATGILLFGIALIYGTTGSFNLVDIGRAVGSAQTMQPMMYVGVILIMIGMAFKISAVPFHFWAPDVYQGAPTVITAFMASIVKTAAFAAFLRLFITCFGPLKDQWSDVLWVIAVATLFIGNITAIAQTSIKRMLAYSSVSHAGYMLLALIALNEASSSSVLFYSLAYSASTIAAFTVLHVVLSNGLPDDVSSFNGLAKRSPMLAITMVIALLSFAGIPPTGGFFAKYYVFSVALKNGYNWLVVLAVISSLISVVYYFRIISAMFVAESAEVKPAMSGFQKIALITSSALVIILGIFPEFLVRLF
jgi:NADH-quinone oxidoreductase subunit N